MCGFVLALFFAPLAFVSFTSTRFFHYQNFKQILKLNDMRSIALFFLVKIAVSSKSSVRIIFFYFCEKRHLNFVSTLDQQDTRWLGHFNSSAPSNLEIQGVVLSFCLQFWFVSSELCCFPCIQLFCQLSQIGLLQKKKSIDYF